MAEPTAAPPKAPAAAAAVDRAPVRSKLRRRMSDEELMRELEGEETDTFYIDPDVIPKEVVYEWKRHEVYGKEDRAYEADLIRRNFVPVLYEDHPGYFGPKHLKGHVLRQGQGLYKMDKTEHENRMRYQQLLARRAVSEQERTLGLAPSGTFERKGARIEKEYAPAPGDMNLE